MAKLTMFSRFLITLAIVGAVYFGLRTFVPSLGLGGSSTDLISGTGSSNTAPDSETTTPSSTPTPQAQKPATGASKFDFTPPAPVSGKLKGVVEVGAQGFNSFVIRVDQSKNWKMEKADYGSSLVYESMATDSDIRNGLKNYITNMINFGVAKKDIHFVVSSGAKKVPIMDKIIGELKGMGYVVNTVTPDQEARHGWTSAMPREYAGKGFFVDIGSGNTKIAWKSGSNILTRECSGAKYYQNKTPDTQVYKEVNARAQDIPSGNRSICFIIGGVPFDLAKQDGKKEDRFTVLRSPNGYASEGEKMKAGLNIYKAIADATGCEQFVFDWQANFTIGFLLGLPY